MKPIWRLRKIAQLGFGQRPEVGAVEQYSALARSCQGTEHRQQGRFAGARAADNRYELARVQFEAGAGAPPRTRGDQRRTRLVSDCADRITSAGLPSGSARAGAMRRTRHAGRKAPTRPSIAEKPTASDRGHLAAPPRGGHENGNAEQTEIKAE